MFETHIIVFAPAGRTYYSESTRSCALSMVCRRKATFVGTQQHIISPRWQSLDVFMLSCRVTEFLTSTRITLCCWLCPDVVHDVILLLPGAPFQPGYGTTVDRRSSGAGSCSLHCFSSLPSEHAAVYPVPRARTGSMPQITLVSGSTSSMLQAIFSQTLSYFLGSMTFRMSILLLFEKVAVQPSCAFFNRHVECCTPRQTSPRQLDSTTYICAF